MLIPYFLFFYCEFDHIALSSCIRDPSDMIKAILVQEEVGLGEDGSEETVLLLEPNSSFGEISILCNIPQPYTVRVCELCRLLRLDKQSFTSILDIYFYDGRKILNNLLEVSSLWQSYWTYIICFLSNFSCSGCQSYG